MIHCIAIDDEPRALSVIKSHASKLDFLSLDETFVDPIKALRYLETHAVDLVFLDIQMPSINGLEVLKQIPTKPQVIFTTAHSEYALESYEVEAVDYLLKPFDFARFMLAATRARDRMKTAIQPERTFMFVNTGTQKQRIVWDEILYIEGDGNYVRYVMTSGKVLVRASVKDTLKILPATQFVQIHRSHIVALQAIEKIGDNHVFIADQRLPISNSYREAFLTLIDSLNRS